MASARQATRRKQAGPKFSLQFLSSFVEEPGQFDVLGGNSLGVVCSEMDVDPIVDVRPLGVMSHFLDSERRGRHESKGVNEVREFVFAMEFPLVDLPAGELG